MSRRAADRAPGGKSQANKGMNAVESERVPGAIVTQGEIAMGSISFKRITQHESRILDDGDHVGDVYRQDDVLCEGAHFYVVHLSEDLRGPRRVHERHRIREIAQHLVDTRPLF